MSQKLTPQDVEIEAVVLGTLMLDNKPLITVMGSLAVDKFYEPKHQHIYSAIETLYLANSAVDILTVTRELRKAKVLEAAGGPMYVSSLTNRVASTANLEQWVAILTELYIKRQLAVISAQINARCYDMSVDVFDISDSFSTSMANLFSSNMRANAQHISKLTSKATDNILHRQKAEAMVSGYSTSIPAVDKLLGGHQKSDLMYMAGRPAMGKTAMALTEVLNLGLNGTPVAFFSLEMSSMQIVYRLIAMLSGIDGSKLMKYKLSDAELRQYYSYLDKINSLPIYIDDTAGLSVYDLRARVKQLKEKHGIEIIYIDYVQLMSIGNQLKKQGQNREQELSIISRNLKLIAKECDIPVIALSQLSRSVESRSDKRPLLSDLRESGSLEQDADIVTFLYRPEYYGVKADDAGNSTANLGEYIIAKQRNGSIGIAPMHFAAGLMMYKPFNNNPDIF